MENIDIDLSGKRILVAQDNHSSADGLCDELRSFGARVLGPAPSPLYAIALLGGKGVDCAVLDTSHSPQLAIETARELLKRRIPAVLTLDPDAPSVPAQLSAFSFVRIPHSADAVAALVMAEIAKVPRTPPRPQAIPLVLPSNASNEQLMAFAVARAFRRLYNDGSAG